MPSHIDLTTIIELKRNDKELYYPGILFTSPSGKSDLVSGVTEKKTNSLAWITAPVFNSKADREVECAEKMKRKIKKTKINKNKC